MHSALEIIFKRYWLPSCISAPESLFITVISKAITINKLLSKVLPESHITNWYNISRCSFADQKLPRHGWEVMVAVNVGY